MSAETTNWVLLGFIVLQATFMAWMTHDSHKSFTTMSDQVGRLIDILHEVIDPEDDADEPANTSGNHKGDQALTDLSNSSGVRE